jgi:hypothetical protein
MEGVWGKSIIGRETSEDTVQGEGQLSLIEFAVLNIWRRVDISEGGIVDEKKEQGR